MLISPPSTIEGFLYAPHTQSRLHNYYNISGVLAPRGGWIRSSKYDDGVRPSGSSDYFGLGLMVSADGSKLYSIFGGKVYVTTSFNSIGTSIGSISVTQKDVGSRTSVKYAVGFTGIAISAGARQYFIDTDLDTITQKTFDANFATSDVSYIDARYVWVQDGGDNLVYYSEVNDALNIPSLNFFDAESRPDGNKASAVIGNDLYIFGSNTTERFRNSGAVSNPVVRVTNSVISVGYVGGKIELAGEVLFIGRVRGGGLGVFSLSGSSLTKISNRSVDETLNYVSEWSLGFRGLEISWAQSFNEYGLDITVFSIPSVNDSTELSLACYQGDGGYQWSVLSDNPGLGEVDYQEWGRGSPPFIKNEDNGKNAFNIRNAVFFDNKWIAQREDDLANSGLFIKQVGTYYDESEDDEPVTRGFLSQIAGPLDKGFNLASMRLVYSSSFTFEDSADINFNFSIKPDEWSTDKTQDIVTGQKLQANTSGGLVADDGHLGILIETRSLNPLFIEKVLINV